MADLDTPAVLTLKAFLDEANLPPDTGSVSKGDLTLETVLQEKKVFDLSLKFEKFNASEDDQKWSLPAPSCPARITSMPTSSNILNVSVDALATEDGSKQCVIVSTADRRLSELLPGSDSFELVGSQTHLHQAPILSWVLAGDGYLISTSMSGQTVLSSSRSNEILDVRKDHSKYVVKATTYRDEASGRLWLATAGWDAKVHIYNPSLPHGDRSAASKPSLNSPIASITLPTNPEALLFLLHPTTSQLLLLLSRRDSTFLYYYDISQIEPTQAAISSTSPDPATSGPSNNPPLLGRQNLAPYSNAWIAFTPSALAPSPLDPTLLAIATNSVPHMKLLIVRLLFSAAPFSDHHPATTSSTATSSNPNTDASSSNASSTAAAVETRLREREAAALLVTATTHAPQTPYSTPALAWRPDGTGVWVNGDDGVVRGVEARSGKVVARLGPAAMGEEEGGHEAGTKVRCLWAGMVEVGRRDGEEGEGEKRWEELVVSGGFDQRLIVWRCGSASA
ncbi:MAG: hypothetical protein M1821_007437 [Bathelium mastoideum]|nr:MAG: hypothetical protein M1821_007437 [Bathelium mastoideum]